MAEDPKDAEDGGVLRNLPRTRPGRRSDKRSAGRPAEAAGAAARRAEAGGGAAARTPRPKRAGAQRKPAGARPRRPAAAASEPGTEPSRGGPIEGAVHTAGKIAGAGARLAEGLAKEVLRRLPRP
jgi:hypothetical protein